MSLGASSSDSSSESSSTFDENVWGVQGGALKDLYASAGGLFDSSMSNIQGIMPGASDWMTQIQNMSNPAWQDQMAGGAYQDMNLQNNLMGSLNQSLNNPSMMSEVNAMIMGGEGNNYADAMKSQYMQDADRAQNQMMSNMDARANAYGQGGSSRHGVAQGIGMEGINRELQRNLAQTGFNSFDKDLDRKLEIAGMADQGTLARQQMMSNMIGGQQDAMAGGLDYGSQMQNLGMGAFSPYMVPWDMMGQYTNTLGAPTVLGSGKSTGESDASSWGISGSMGGF